jgi:hypothetical protein
MFPPWFGEMLEKSGCPNTYGRRTDKKKERLIFYKKTKKERKTKTNRRWY